MTNVFNCSHMAEVVTYSLSCPSFFWLIVTPFIWFSSKLDLNYDLVLSSSLGNHPQLTTQSLLLVKPAFVEYCFLFQASIWLFAQYHVYLQIFQLFELQANGFDEFQLSAVQCLHFKSIFFKVSTFFILAMFAGTLCTLSTKIHLKYVELFSNIFNSKSIQEVVILLSISWSVN